MKMRLLMVALSLLCPLSRSRAASPVVEASGWTPIFQSLAGSQAAARYAGAALPGASLEGVLSRLSAVDWSSAQGRALAAPVERRLESLGVAPDHPEAAQRAAEAVAATAADLGSQLEEVSRLSLDDALGDKRSEVAARLDALSRYAAFLSPREAAKAASYDRAFRAGLAEQRQARAVEMIEGAQAWGERVAAAAEDAGAPVVHLRRRKSGLEPVLESDGFQYLPLNVRSTNESDRRYRSARARVLALLDGAQAAAADKFLDRAVRFAKEEARENGGEKVSVGWLLAPGRLEVVVRREADRPLAAFASGTPMRSWHERRWRKSLMAEPGLPQLLTLARAEVLPGSPSGSEAPGVGLLTLSLPVADGAASVFSIAGFASAALDVGAGERGDASFQAALNRIRAALMASPRYDSEEYAAAARFLSQAARLAKKAARAHGESVFVDWKIDGARMELAVRRQGRDRHPQGAVSWLDDLWRAPGLRERLTRLRAEVFTEPVDDAGDFNQRLLVVVQRRAP